MYRNPYHGYSDTEYGYHSEQHHGAEHVVGDGLGSGTCCHIRRRLYLATTTPMKVMSNDGRLIGQFGEQKRSPLQFDEIPSDFVNALLAAEDPRMIPRRPLLQDLGEAPVPRDLARLATGEGVRF